MVKIKNILVPVDFSEGSKNSMNYAVEIAKSMDAMLHIIHVIEPIIFSSDIVMTKYGFDELPNELEIYANKDIELITKTLIDTTLGLKTKILHGRADEEILTYAHKNHIDLICIATHGRGNFENLFFGSIAEKVLRKSICPVLSIRVKDSKE